MGEDTPISGRHATDDPAAAYPVDLPEPREPQYVRSSDLWAAVGVVSVIFWVIELVDAWWGWSLAVVLAFVIGVANGKFDVWQERRHRREV